MFTPTSQTVADFVADPFALRSRIVRVEVDAARAQDALELVLFDDIACVAFREAQAADGATSDTWTGRMPDDPASRVNLIVRDGIAVGTVRWRGALYKIRPAGTERGLAAIEQIDENRLPQCASTRTHEVVASGHSGSTPSVADTSALQAQASVDIMVMYTPQAKVGAGGQTAIEALIDLAVLETNQIYTNSLANLRIRLVHKGEVAYTESGSFGTELARLQNASDGHMDQVHQLRDLHGADMVSLIVNAYSSCGIGYVMTNPSSSFQGYAFSAVSKSCATGYYSFAHELGHNFGCQHDRQSGGSGAYSFSYGYRNPAGTWRTVMAYPPGTRIPYFSNPSVSYLGQATGVPASSALGCDNAQTMSLTAPTVVAFRDSGTTVYGQGKLNSLGQVPQLAPVGVPSLASSGFRLDLKNAVPWAPGFLHVSSQLSSTPFHGGTLLAALPLTHGVDFRVGTNGTVALPLSVTAALVGRTYYYQALYRDVAHADQTNAGLSNGVKITYTP